MYFHNQNSIRNINKPNRFGGKENNHSLSPNVRQIHGVNRPIQNTLFPKNQLMFNNNHNYNIKVNKIPRQKEKIIEGDLNFNNTTKQFYMKNSHKHNFLNNKTKNRGMPRKSPLPISGTFRPKDMLNFNRIFNSSNYRYVKPEPKKFNKTNNMFKPMGGNNHFINNYIFGGTLNANMSKSFNSFSKNKDRSHTPLLRTGENKGITLGIKVNKNRYVSKSPNLGKGSMLNKNGGNFSISLLNKNNVKKRIVKKSPNNNNINANNININNNNYNNNKKVNNVKQPSQKRNTIISGELCQEPSKPNKNNYVHNNININKGSNMPNVNLRPISNNNKLSVSSNNNPNNNNMNNLYNNYSINSMNPLRNKSNENLLKNNLAYSNNSNSHNNIINNNQKSASPQNVPENDGDNNKAINDNKNIVNNNISNAIKNENNLNDNNYKNNNNKIREELNIKPINSIQQLENSNNNNNDILRSNPPQVKNVPNVNAQKNEEKNIPIESQKVTPIEKQEEIKEVKKNVRSLSQTPINPLNKNSNSDDMIKKKEIQKIEENQKKTPGNGKIFKRIRDILPYTHVGFDGEEPKENNQDNYFIFKNFADNKDYIYLSVCDGHGVEGHFVSEFIKEVLPYYMSENLINRDILSETDKELIHQIITETFLIVNNMLVSNENINSLFSGSTCVSVIYTPQRLIVPNIGDSRAVLGRYDKNTGKYKAIELSRDHKPTEKDEAKRIYENDGRIQPFTEDGEFVGPQRVWIKEEEVPGLAMTRSFGDRVAASVGVISEPEIKEFDFDENDKYMIIASDGIWEFISSQECIDIIQKYYENNDLKGCCEYLYQESSKRWLKEEEVIDDTTLILVFFE